MLGYLKIIFMLKIALFASGNGSNAENIYQSFFQKEDISFGSIYCNKPDAFVLQRANLLNLSTFVFTKYELENSEKVLNKLHEENIDLIVLCGFLLKIPEGIIKDFENRIINIHPALLPKYGGKGMYGMNVHNAVKANNESKTGISIHLVNQHYDEGAILYQAECSIDETDSPEEIANKVHQLEYEYFPKIVLQYIKEIIK